MALWCDWRRHECCGLIKKGKGGETWELQQKLCCLLFCWLTCFFSFPVERWERITMICFSFLVEFLERAGSGFSANWDLRSLRFLNSLPLKHAAENQVLEERGRVLGGLVTWEVQGLWLETPTTGPASWTQASVSPSSQWTGWFQSCGRCRLASTSVCGRPGEGQGDNRGCAWGCGWDLTPSHSSLWVL